MSTPAPTYYELLEVSPNASTEEIRSAYRQQVLRIHPDQGGNKALFRMVENAYQVLTDPQRRMKYDDDLHATPPGGYQFAENTFDPPTRAQPRYDARSAEDAPFVNDPYASDTAVKNTTRRRNPFAGARQDSAIQGTWRLTKFLLITALVIWVIVAAVTPLQIIPGMNDGMVFWAGFWLVFCWLFLSVGLRLAGWIFALFSILDAAVNHATPELTAVRLLFCLALWLVGHWIYTFKTGEYRSVMAAGMLTKLPRPMRPDRRWLHRGA